MKFYTLLLSTIATLCLSSSASAWCLFNCNYTKTENPIVLAHGLMGWDSVAGIEYFYGVADKIKSNNGGATVYTTEVSAVNSSVARGEQLIAQLDEIRAITGKPNLKFNLIGHSQGGLDSRYVAGVRPDLVASVTTVGSPHLGGDPALLGVTGIVTPEILDLMESIIELIYGTSNPTDAAAMIELFDPDNIAEFNAGLPGGMPSTYCGQGASVTQTSAGPIRNYSWTGDSPFTNALDPIDYFMGLLAAFYSSDSDGLVLVCSAHFGQVLRDNYRMNHMDEVNQLFGITSIFETDPKSVYRTHVNRLKNAGL